MGAGSNERNSVVILIPYQEPVRFNMAFPIRSHIARKTVCFEPFLKQLIYEQFVDDASKFL